eukprot:2363375-Rhodomonas_salina.2
MLRVKIVLVNTDNDDADNDEVCVFQYMLLVMIVLVNIVLAVLLDEFLKAADQEKIEQNLERQEGVEFVHLKNPLDPLLCHLVPTPSLSRCDS